ncbi:hypothetical protein [Psychrobium sp. 1_MG-2023]|uniref:hypothetical protein n=1 Tax=Psychrobium sp. 1_MG-2023 TaxID=3062624 RepID=UPI000C321D6E|nr:hypothetical protein [Psychrobium sp. 1_MG-2023]MDP2559690.1 hypothetical protein [Psychrobium sp. 1_MG-2023]PKF59521.1 hypothetical protein CW748_01745 [Alteromonadales bacterium alter-6D02]
MANVTNTFRAVVVTTTIAIASLGVSANAAELNSQTKQDLFNALGKVFSSQVSAIAGEISSDIERTINENLVELGLEIAEKTKQQDADNTDKANSSK